MSLLKLLFLLLLSVALLAHGRPPSTLLPTGPGPEDLALIQWGGRPALITATARRMPWQKGRPQGGLEIHEPGGPPAFTAIPGAYPGDWCPVGLCTVTASTAPGLAGKQLLYVINTVPSKGTLGGRVEVFEIGDQTKTLKHLCTLGQTPLLTRPNSIIATRNGSVYVSNFSLFPQRGLTPNVNPEAATPVANSIVRHSLAGNGTGSWSVVATGINGANGLALSPDEAHLLCNAYHDKKVLAFTRAPGGGLTSFATVLDGIPFHPDNLKTLPNGRYCTAGQRSFIASSLHLLTVGLLPARSSAATFTFVPNPTTREPATDFWEDAMHPDYRCPSTALPHGRNLYLSHLLRSGVLRIEVE